MPFERGSQNEQNFEDSIRITNNYL